MLTLSRGCTTPKVISHILSDWDGMNAESREKDYSLLDGYDDLPEVFQEKIREALIQGHVDDEEWNGVSDSLPLCLWHFLLMHGSLILTGC